MLNQVCGSFEESQTSVPLEGDASLGQALVSIHPTAPHSGQSFVEWSEAVERRMRGNKGARR